jgi:hypothetical protein
MASFDQDLGGDTDGLGSLPGGAVMVGLADRGLLGSGAKT